MLRRQRKFNPRGAVAVEALLVISALLIFMFAIFEYGRYVMLRHLLDNAAREGARLAVGANVSDTNSFNYQTTATIQNTVLTALGGQNQALTGLNPTVYLADLAGNNIGNWTNAQVGQNIAVQVDATYSPIFPTLGFLPTSVPMTTKSVMRTEAN